MATCANVIVFERYACLICVVKMITAPTQNKTQTFMLHESVPFWPLMVVTRQDFYFKSTCIFTPWVRHEEYVTCLGINTSANFLASIFWCIAFGREVVFGRRFCKRSSCVCFWPCLKATKKSIFFGSVRWSSIEDDRMCDMQLHGFNCRSVAYSLQEWPPPLQLPSVCIQHVGIYAHLIRVLSPTGESKG